jgi:arylsulfatase A-like enzyme
MSNPPNSRALAGLLLGIVVLLASPGRAVAERRPPRNILVVITDDQRWDALSVVQAEQGDKGRFPWLKTPAIDRLAKSGTRFRNAFVTCSLCSPSRATLLTGQHAHVHGVMNNITPFPKSSINWAESLRKHGYATGFFGKFHHGSGKERPGFTHWATYLGHGQYHDCPLIVDDRTVKTKGWVDDVVTEHLCEFIKTHHAKPFAAVLALKATHDPWTPPDRHKGAYQNESMRDVPNLKLIPGYWDGDKPPKKVANRKPAYFECLLGVDDNVSRVMKLLDELKLTNNTLIVFTSDNGFYLGEHGLSDKQTPYEESLRVPLLISLPGEIEASSLRDQLVLNIDLAPTILETAGIEIPSAMQGRSLWPLLKNDATPWRSAFLYLYSDRTSKGVIPATVAVRASHSKLITYPDKPGIEEAYDLAIDPYETKNLIKDPDSAKLVANLRKALEEEKSNARFEGFGASGKK